MTDRVPRKEGPPRSRLESWLVRKIQAGGLKSLPRYYPLQGRGNQCPEQYARTLLAGLRRVESDALSLERLRDDGRAFRSWAESALTSVTTGSDNRLNRVSQSFVV